MPVFLPALFVLVAAERPTAPIALDLSIASFSDICTTLRQKTGVSFDCAPNIKDRKVTLLCGATPADQVMARLEEGIFVRFVPRGQGFLMEANPDVMAEELRYERALTNARLDATRVGIARAIDLAKVPADQRMAETEGLRKKYNEAKSPEEKAIIGVDLSLREQIRPEDRSMWDAGKVLAQLSRNEIEAMLAGRPILADNAELGTGHQMPPDSYAYGMTQSKGKGVMGILQYEPETGHLKFGQRSMPTAESSGGGVLRGIPTPSPTVKDQALTARISAWAKVRDAAVDGKAIPQEGEPPKEASPKGLLSMVEHFVWLHTRTGIPIVAEVTRVASSFPEPFMGKTIEEWMKETTIRRTFDANWQLYNFHTDNGWLMARASNLIRLRKIEVPERNLQPLAGKADLTLDEMTWFAGNLTDDQATGLNEMTWAYPVSLVKVNMALQGLRVYAALGPTRRQAFNAGGIPKDKMPLAARQKLETLFMRRLTGGWPEPSLVPYITGAARLDGAPMGFLVEETGINTIVEERQRDMRKGGFGYTGKNYEGVRFRAKLGSQDFDEYLPLKMKDDPFAPR
ncbi:hypothetical protein EON81_11430 [bacterium]|nr:MAG: hypothetical protein EON81_11430 [bacterium]